MSVNYLQGRASELNLGLFSFSLGCPFKVPSRRFKTLLGTIGHLGMDRLSVEREKQVIWPILETVDNGSIRVDILD